MGVMGLAEIMDRSVDIIRKYIKTISLFTLSYGVIAGIIAVIMIVVSVVPMAFLGERLESFIIPIIVFTIIGFLSFAFYLSLYIGIIKISSQEFFPERVYVSDAIGSSFKSILKVLGIVIISIIIYIPVLAAFGAIGYFLFRALEGSTVPIGIYKTREIILIIISIITVIAAFFLFSVYSTLFTFSLQALVVEKRGVIGSLMRSLKLVKGRLWKVFGFNMLSGLVLMAMQYSLESFLALVVSIIFLILKLLNVQQDYMGFLGMAYVNGRWPFYIISWLVISPLGAIMPTLLYFNERFKREGYDLVLRLKEIEKNEERKQENDAVELNNPS